jgi:nicotinamidase-related amidase
VRQLGADHVILTGIEAHVCVLLTALDRLREACAYRPWPTRSLAPSRESGDRARLGPARQAGAIITATETVVFQLLGSADFDAFRELCKRPGAS